MTTQFRPPTPADASGIAATHVASWQRAYAGLLPQDFLDDLSVAERTESWTRVLTEPTPGVSSVVAELDGRIVGFTSVGPCRDDDAAPGAQELWALYVHPDCWGTGQGHALHTLALTTLRATAAPTVGASLWVLDGNQRARRFYEQHGWRPDGEAKVEWRGDVRLDEVRYRHSLAPEPA